MSKTVKIDDLADEVMKGLTEYSNLATADMKKAVRKAGNDVRKEIQDTAPIAIKIISSKCHRI